MTSISRRDVMKLGSGAGLATAGSSMLMCTTALMGSSAAVAAVGDDTSTPLGRLKVAARDSRQPVRSYDPLIVTQGQQNSASPVMGAGAVVYPTPRGSAVNPNPVTLADLPQVWGFRRDTWTRQTGAGYIGATIPGYGSWYVPIARVHRAQTKTSNITCGLHFTLTGQAFEVLFAGTDARITLVVDGKYMAYQNIATTSSGAPLSNYNCFTRFDFGYRATRRISLYGWSTQGACALAIAPGDQIEPWVRSTSPSMCVMADSYGGARGANWNMGGPFFEAAAALGIPHIDLNAIGGTGYAPNNTNDETRQPGNAFGPRLPDSVNAAPDLFFTAGGINDNNSFAAPPLYNSAAQALASFNNAVYGYYRSLRASLPNSVLAAMGPWAPRESIPPNPVELSKLQTIRAALQSVGGPWIFLDNLNGGWSNSAGASSPATGRGWQTGTGKLDAPHGDGNADIYISADGTHPTLAGCAYLGEVLASNLRAALLAL